MILGVTGHRPTKLGGYARSGLLRDFAASQLREIQPDRVFTGMALGWDTAIAYACIDLRIPFLAYVPFDGQESNWPAQSRRDYDWLTDRAAEVVIVCPGAYAPWKMQRRNEAIVDDSDETLACFDGTSGGTSNCVAYALKQKKPITNVYEDWLQFMKVPA